MDRQAIAFALIVALCICAPLGAYLLWLLGRAVHRAELTLTERIAGVTMTVTHYLDSIAHDVNTAARVREYQSETLAKELATWRAIDLSQRSDDPEIADLVFPLEAKTLRIAKTGESCELVFNVQRPGIMRALVLTAANARTGEPLRGGSLGVTSVRVGAIVEFDAGGVAPFEMFGPRGERIPWFDRELATGMLVRVEIVSLGDHDFPIAIAGCVLADLPPERRAPLLEVRRREAIGLGTSVYIINCDTRASMTVSAIVQRPVTVEAVSLTLIEDEEDVSAVSAWMEVHEAEDRPGARIRRLELVRSSTDGPSWTPCHKLNGEFAPVVVPLDIGDRLLVGVHLRSGERPTFSACAFGVSRPQRSGGLGREANSVGTQVGETPKADEKPSSEPGPYTPGASAGQRQGRPTGAPQANQAGGDGRSESGGRSILDMLAGMRPAETLGEAARRMAEELTPREREVMARRFRIAADAPQDALYRVMHDIGTGAVTPDEAGRELAEGKGPLVQSLVSAFAGIVADGIADADAKDERPAHRRTAIPFDSIGVAAGVGGAVDVSQPELDARFGAFREYLGQAAREELDARLVHGTERCPGDEHGLHAWMRAWEFSLDVCNVCGALHRHIVRG